MTNDRGEHTGEVPRPVAEVVSPGGDFDQMSLGDKVLAVRMGMCTVAQAFADGSVTLDSDGVFNQRVSDATIASANQIRERRALNS